MTLQEIFVLNKVLDGKDIYSLPSFSDFGISQLLYDTAKDLLIERKLLAGRDEFTDEGVLVTKRLMEFKTAKKYISMPNLSIGLVDSERAVMINKNNENDYDITLIDLEDSEKQVLGFFDYADDTKNSKTLTPKEITPTDLEKEYGDKTEIIRLRTVTENMETDELYFVNGGQIYVYDYFSYSLSHKSYKDLAVLLKERLVF